MTVISLGIALALPRELSSQARGEAGARGDTGSIAIADTVRRAFDDMMAAYRARDSTRILSHFASGDDVTAVGDGHFLRGFERLSETFRSGIRMLASYDSLRVDQVHVQVLAADVAVHSADYHAVYTLVGGERRQLHSTWMNVFRRLGGEWKIVSSAFSDVPER